VDLAVAKPMSTTKSQGLRKESILEIIIGFSENRKLLSYKIKTIKSNYPQPKEVSVITLAYLIC